MNQISDRAPLSPDSLLSGHTTTGVSSLYLKSELSSNVKPLSHRRRRFSRNHKQAQFSTFEEVDDESYEESCYDVEDDGSELCDNQNDHKSPKVGRSCSLDICFARSPSLVNKTRQRSLSYPSFIPRSSRNTNKEILTRTAISSVSIDSSVILSTQTLATKAETASTRIYGRCTRPSKRFKFITQIGSKHVPSPSTPDLVRHGYCKFPRGMQHVDLESEVDDEEEFYYTGETEFYEPTAVIIPPSYKNRLHALKRENAQLRLHLQRVTRQRDNLRAENHSLVKENLKLRKLGATGRDAVVCGGVIPMKLGKASFLSTSIIRQPSRASTFCQQPCASARRKIAGKSAFGASSGIFAHEKPSKPSFIPSIAKLLWE